MNYHIWSGVCRHIAYPPGRRGRIGALNPHPFPTVVVDMHLLSWALPLAVHVGGPLLGKPGVTVRIGPLNIGWSRL